MGNNVCNCMYYPVYMRTGQIQTSFLSSLLSLFHCLLFSFTFLGSVLPFVCYHSLFFTQSALSYSLYIILFPFPIPSLVVLFPCFNYFVQLYYYFSFNWGWLMGNNICSCMYYLVYVRTGQFQTSFPSSLLSLFHCYFPSISTVFSFAIVLSSISIYTVCLLILSTLFYFPFLFLSLSFSFLFYLLRPTTVFFYLDWMTKKENICNCMYCPVYADGPFAEFKFFIFRAFFIV